MTALHDLREELSRLDAAIEHVANIKRGWLETKLQQAEAELQHLRHLQKEDAEYLQAHKDAKRKWGSEYEHMVPHDCTDHVMEEVRLLSDQLKSGVSAAEFKFMIASARTSGCEKKVVQWRDQLYDAYEEEKAQLLRILGGLRKCRTEIEFGRPRSLASKILRNVVSGELQEYFSESHFQQMMSSCDSSFAKAEARRGQLDKTGDVVRERAATLEAQRVLSEIDRHQPLTPEQLETRISVGMKAQKSALAIVEADRKRNLSWAYRQYDGLDRTAYLQKLRSLEWARSLLKGDFGNIWGSWERELHDLQHPKPSSGYHQGSGKYRHQPPKPAKEPDRECEPDCEPDVPGCYPPPLTPSPPDTPMPDAPPPPKPWSPRSPHDRNPPPRNAPPNPPPRDTSPRSPPRSPPPRNPPPRSPPPRSPPPQDPPPPFASSSNPYSATHTAYAAAVRKWHSKCVSVFSDPSQMTAFPCPPTLGCLDRTCQAKASARSLDACHHEIQRAFELLDVDLKKERLRWHPDRFGLCDPALDKFKEKASEVFVVVNKMFQDE